MRKSVIKLLGILIFELFIFCQSNAQAGGLLPSQIFIQKLNEHCGKSFYGKITSGGKQGDGFTGETLIIRIDKCQKEAVNIPFFVGNNRSRTWLITETGGLLTLKHDHRNEDGTPDRITMYGGTATNTGLDSMQIFPADDETCLLINYACANVWWFTISDTKLTYNLRRIGSDRVFSVSFDLTKSFDYKETAWGW